MLYAMPSLMLERALFATSVILIAGFAVLTFSSFRLNASMGQLTAIAIGAALIADFILLFRRLLLTGGQKEKTTEKPRHPPSPNQRTSCGVNNMIKSTLKTIYIDLSVAWPGAFCPPPQILPPTGVWTLPLPPIKPTRVGATIPSALK